MNPHQQNKVDISTLSPDEQRLFRLYGKLPNKKDLLQNKLKERKYFDSGDYALSKAGKASDIGVTAIGREHPVPEKIPHIAPPASALNHNSQTNGQDKGQGGGSPIKEGSFLHRETSLNRETSAADMENEAAQEIENIKA
ncbi:Endosulfine-domain-containing protein [Pleomassaria siparia CBS 279.74]|uniref:mRNA stability protein n=1 Tax=Pleomassaria siparia CBS 279.74 TaxID=1314801 RepID=A0A6G1JWD1_9PLEO|nr:Endosulfine-domain-containing protein [Pleomassaria siparia CBS 279.74]